MLATFANEIEGFAHRLQTSIIIARAGAGFGQQPQKIGTAKTSPHRPHCVEATLDFHNAPLDVAVSSDRPPPYDDAALSEHRHTVFRGRRDKPLGKLSRRADVTPVLANDR